MNLFGEGIEFYLTFFEVSNSLLFDGNEVYSVAVVKLERRERKERRKKKGHIFFLRKEQTWD